MNLGKVVLTLALLSSAVSCSSYFIRKGCEKVNWFQHAHDVAMRGQRLEEDARFKECEKAETEINSAEMDRGFKMGMQNYCKLETAFNKGLEGLTYYNYEFCDSNMVPRLKTQYTEGLKKFCTPDYGYTFASQGGVYKQQCAKDIEPSYLAQYNKGRQIFLRNKIASHEAEIKGIDSEISVEQNRASQVTFRISSLPHTRVTTKTKRYDAATKTYKEETSVSEDPSITRQRRSLEYELSQAHSNISNKQDQQRRLRSEIHTMKSELESLNK